MSENNCTVTFPKQKFTLGQVVATQGALQVLGAGDKNAAQEMLALLKRHAHGDWGDVLPAEDKKVNNAAVANGRAPQRVLSAYQVNGQKVWVITEWDRSVTTVLLPSEY